MLVVLQLWQQVDVITINELLLSCLVHLGTCQLAPLPDCHGRWVIQAFRAFFNSSHAIELIGLSGGLNVSITAHCKSHLRCA